MGASVSGAVASLSLVVCLWLTRQQVQCWHDSIALFRHSIAVDEDNATIRYLFGAALQGIGAPEAEVVAEYRRALQLDPSYVNALTQLCVISLNHKDYDQSRGLIEQSL